MIQTPINNGLLQSDLDCAGFDLLNFTGGGGGGGSGLDANTVTAADIGLVGNGVTDNTVVLQAWLDSVAAAKVNSTLLVPDGVYVFSGALQDGSSRNAQILLPSNALADRQYTITIKGYHPISFIPWPDASVPMPDGPIFKSTFNTGSGTRPSFIGGMGPSGGLIPYLSFVCLRFEDMIFQMPSNPQLSCLNLSHYSVVELLGDVLVVAGNGIGESDSVQPTTTTSYGFIQPPDSESVLQLVDNLNVFNFYTGILVGELAHISNLGCYLCYNAIEMPFANHGTIIERVEDWHCLNGIRMTGTHGFQVYQYDVEKAPGGRWYTRNYDVDDGSNQATADITWWTVTAYVGPDNSFTMNGGSGIKARRVGAAFDASPVYIGTDARMTAVSGGVKLEARNTGTGVWVEAARWTNP